MAVSTASSWTDPVWPVCELRSPDELVSAYWQIVCQMYWQVTGGFYMINIDLVFKIEWGGFTTVWPCGPYVTICNHPGGRVTFNLPVYELSTQKNICVICFCCFVCLFKLSYFWHGAVCGLLMQLDCLPRAVRMCHFVPDEFSLRDDYQEIKAV